MTDEGRKRPRPISYRIPKGQEAEFYARAAEHGGSINAFITDRTLSVRRRNRAELRLLAQLLAKAAQISDRLHEVSLAGGSGGALEIEAALQELTEIRAALMELMGRKP